jgi:hypothetical protein
MSNKTIYIKNEEVWNKADEEARKLGISRSELIYQLIKKFVREKEYEEAVRGGKKKPGDTIKVEFID